MTIPIVPGPFSFLESIGRGFSNYVGGREAVRRTAREEGQEDRKEAFDKLGFLFRGIQTGDIDAKVVKSPMFLDLVQRSGFAEGMGEGGAGGLSEAVTPNPQSALRQAQNEALMAQLPEIQGDPNAQRLLAARGTAPLRSEVINDEIAQLVGGFRRAGLRSGTPAQKEVLSGVPSETSANLLVGAAQNPELDATADRIVQAAAAEAGRGNEPDFEVLRQKAAGDLRARRYGPEVTDVALGAALGRWRDKQRVLEAGEERAKYYGRRGTVSADDYIRKNIQPEMTNLNNTITRNNSEITKKRDSLSPLGKLGKPRGPDEAILAEIAELEAANAKAREEYDILKQRSDEIRKLGTVDERTGEAAEEGEETTEGEEEEAPAPKPRRGAAAPADPNAGLSMGQLAEKRRAWDAAASAIKANPILYGFGPGVTDAQIAEYLGHVRP